MVEVFRKLSNVEADIIRYFVWREITSEDYWFKDGMKELASSIGRHRKSVEKAIVSLEGKGMIRTEKNGNILWIRHTLANEELYTRMAFIDESFSNAESIQVLLKELQEEIERLEKEIALTKKADAKDYKMDKIIDTILEKVADSKFEELVLLWGERTYANSNDSLEKIIQSALRDFRQKIFGQYEEKVVEEKSNKIDYDIYDEFWSRNTKR